MGKAACGAAGPEQGDRGPVPRHRKQNSGRSAVTGEWGWNPGPSRVAAQSHGGVPVGSALRPLQRLH